MPEIALLAALAGPLSGMPADNCADMALATYAAAELRDSGLTQVEAGAGTEDPVLRDIIHTVYLYSFAAPQELAAYAYEACLVFQAPSPTDEAD